MDDKSVLHIIMLKGIRLDYEDALDNALVIKRLSKEKQLLKLIDARLGFSIDKKASAFINCVDLKQTIARAVVKSSVFSRLMLAFFTKMSKPKTPTRIFSDYDKAYKWLLTYKE